MRIARFVADDVPRPRLALVEGDHLLPLPEGTEARTLLDPRADAGAIRDTVVDPVRALGTVRLVAPIEPGKCLAVGMNYAAHADEFAPSLPADRETPTVPTIFTKHVNCITGPNDPVHLPRVSEALDYEGELVLVIGRRARHVPREKALSVVGAWCVGNDVSVRDWQLRTGQFVMGKSFDTHGPIGPWLVTADELGDPADLRIRTWVDDELRQDGRTADMIFDPATLVAHLSQAMTLEPGDLVFTGTPAGVGGAMTPPRWLRAGQRVRVELRRLADDAVLGTLDNPVVPEPDTESL
jgi:2-keto-4-pentenoate hydratase/2-oxohepta-3-ene-1,7-dioic acid hydratase in catechol pathway